MVFHGSTEFETAIGKVQLQELVRHSTEHTDFRTLVLAWGGNKPIVADVGGFSPVGDHQVFSVELDDGAIIRVSPSAKFLLRSGGFKTTLELAVGESLMPIYMSKDAHGYPCYRIPGMNIKQKISRLMAEWKTGQPLPKGTFVEHIDKNRLNYHPDNLKVFVDEKRAAKSRRNGLVTAVNEAADVFEECAVVGDRFAEIVGKKFRGKNNHKVVSVTPGIVETVYSARSGLPLVVSGVFISSAC